MCGTREPDDVIQRWVLVSNEGKFGSVVKELDKRGVELLLVSTSKPSEDLRRVFGDNRSELLEIGAMDGA